MTAFSRDTSGNLKCDDVALQEIAKAYGTPTYVYAQNEIISQYGKLNTALSSKLSGKNQPLLCYACKANSHQAVLTILKNQGAGLEVVSGGELERGLKAGFDPKKIVFTGVGKQPHEIALAVRSGIAYINIESVEEITHVGTVAHELQKEVSVLFRINPDVSGGGHDKISTGRERDKFGISMDRAAEAYTKAGEFEFVKPQGLSMHIGSQVFNVHAFEEAFSKLPNLVQKLRSSGHEVSTLDIGGGFPIPYQGHEELNLDAYATWVNDIIAPLDTKIIMEPGRFMVGNAGILLSRVVSIKKAKEVTFLIVDAAMNDLIRPTLYDAHHEIEPVSKPRENHKNYAVVGPICESGDTFAKDRELPEMKEGDLVAFMSAGAYGYTMASNYNTRGMPAQILVKNDQHSLIKPRQNIEDLLAGESIPDWV